MMEYANLYDELPDPMATMREALRNGEKQKDKEWTATRDDAAAEVAWLVAGFDKPREAKVREQVAGLLDRVHPIWKEKELGDAPAALEKELQEIMGDVGPAEVLRHVIERDLAELLSNPQLAAAIEGRLKEMK